MADKDKKPQSPQSNSRTTIIAVVLAYALKSLVENLSKNNKWPDRGPKEDMK